MSRQIFDGFALRPFNAEYDGWLDEQQAPNFAVQMALSIIELHDQLNALKRENWHLKKDQQSYYEMIGAKPRTKEQA